MTPLHDAGPDDDIERFISARAEALGCCIVIAALIITPAVMAAVAIWGR